MKPVLRTKEAAEFLNLSSSFLEKARVYGGGPPFVRLGSRAVAYRLSDLTDWLEGRVRQSTSERTGTSEPRVRN